LFVICSKSGSTVETLAFYRYFAARADAARFVAITDPGSPLETLARERGFRAVFPHPPDVGGRYAALTVVGMLPAALLGVNGRVLLERALAVDADAARARGTRLAEAVLGGGRDKLVLRPPTPVARLADWIEQLVAESTGKGGRGVVPVVDDPMTTPRPDSRGSRTSRSSTSR
jgi:glucose-6-phosphate isomerase